MDNGGGGVEGRGVCHKAGWRCRAAIMVAGYCNTITTITVGSDVDACYAEHEGVCTCDARSGAGLCNTTDSLHSPSTGCGGGAGTAPPKGPIDAEWAWPSWPGAWGELGLRAAHRSCPPCRTCISQVVGRGTSRTTRQRLESSSSRLGSVCHGCQVIVWNDRTEKKHLHGRREQSHRRTPPAWGSAPSGGASARTYRALRCLRTDCCQGWHQGRLPGRTDSEAAFCLHSRGWPGLRAVWRGGGARGVGNGAHVVGKEI